MEKLYLEMIVEENGEIVVPLETVIVLFVLKYVKATWINLVFVHSYKNTAHFHVRKDKLTEFTIQFISRMNSPQEVSNCLLPVMAKNKNFYMAGLCAVLRYVIKQTDVIHPQDLCRKLLGFRSGCLMACAEVSVWTRFCEVNMTSTTKLHYTKSDKENFILPADLLRFNHHLGQSVRVHNESKHRQNAAKNAKKSKLRLKSFKNKHSTDCSEGDRTDKTLSMCDDTTVFEIDTEFGVGHKKTILEKSFSEKLTLNNYSVFPKEKEITKNVVTNSEDELPNLEHLYAEGIEITLADIILLPCIYYTLMKIKSYESALLEHIPLVLEWYQRMLEDPHVAHCLKDIVNINASDSSTKTLVSMKEKIEIPQIKAESLYIRDPNRIRTISKLKYHQATIEDTIKTLEEKDITAKFQVHPCKSLSLDWSTFPAAVHPIYGQLPTGRSKRKCQQLENLVSVILKIAKTGDTIVDFCSGGGHLGIVLGYLLPECQVIMIDNKEESIHRAMNRIQELKLTNVLIYQSNMDYFKGKFTIGTSLHACGVATDLVLKHCLDMKAALVACPCCYGAIKNVQEISYPRSKQFRESGILHKSYFLLGHAADQTHINDPKAEQGKLCMGIIDTDRLHYLKEHNYSTYLCSLVPLDCTPKNNLLIALPPHRANVDLF